MNGTPLAMSIGQWLSIAGGLARMNHHHSPIVVSANFCQYPHCAEMVEKMTRVLPEISSIEERVRYLAQFEGGLAPLAKAVGLSPRQLGNYLAGRTPWAERRLAAIAAVTEVPMAWLLHGTGSQSDVPGQAAKSEPQGKRSQPSEGPGSTDGVQGLLEGIAGRLSAALQAQADLSSLYEVLPREVVAAYASGEAIPSKRHLAEITRELRLNPNWILGSQNAPIN